MTLTRLFAISAMLLFACLIATSADAANLAINDTSISVTQTRDGRTITLGCQITSDAAATAQLGASLTGPLSEVVKDNLSAGQSVSITAGTNWYYRDFAVNLPPRASTGSTALYDVTFTVKWESSITSTQRLDALTMLAPMSVRIPILMYHKIGDALYSQYWNTTSMLRAQMAALKAYGYTALTCRELMDIRAGLATPPAKPVMLTFDGGYQNFWTNAIPVISAQDYRAVLFLLEGVMGQDNSWDGDNNPVIMFMTWDEVTAAYNTGYVDLQSHTITHPDLTTCSAATRQQELVDSRTDLQNRYGCPVDFFCYPYGAYNDTVKVAVRDAGYFGAFAAWGGVETNSRDKYALKRVPIYWDTVTDYEAGKKFFFTQIGDPLVVPGIAINSVEYLDPVTNNSLAGAQLEYGRSVKIRVTATESGATNSTITSFILDTDSNPENGCVYNTHTASPTQDVTLSGWTGQRTFEWIWTVPVAAPVGQYLGTSLVRDQYYVLGFIKPNYQPAFTVISNLIDLRDAKHFPDNTSVAVNGAIVSAAFTDCFYLESDSRTFGVRVEKPSHDLTAGMRADVVGRVMTNTSGERCISATYAVQNGAGEVKPLGMSNSLLGGPAYGYQDGILGSVGPNNIGLLVRTWGRVKSMDSISRTMVIDDGSGVDLKCIWTGSTVNPAWTYVTVTGISSCEKPLGTLSRLLLITSAEGRP